MSAASTGTLDESVATTLWRDVSMVGLKIFYVIVPVMNCFNNKLHMSEKMRDWDLWGPFAICLVLALVLSQEVNDVGCASQHALVFSVVFVIVSLGSIVVTINASLLGGNVSFFQSVCVLGYCIFPLLVASVVNYFIDIMWIRLITTMAGWVWSTMAALGFMTELVPPNRKALALYPVCLFYLALSWMILVMHSSTTSTGTCTDPTGAGNGIFNGGDSPSSE